MITVIFTKEGSSWKEMECSGHAGYADEGEDIYCSAVSALVTNTYNSLEVLTEDTVLADLDQGYLKITFTQTPSEKGKLLFDSLLLGLSSIRNTCNEEFLQIIVRETD
jgi:hypothetical protein